MSVYFSKNSHVITEHQLLLFVFSLSFSTSENGSHSFTQSQTYQNNLISILGSETQSFSLSVDHECGLFNCSFGEFQIVRPSELLNNDSLDTGLDCVCAGLDGVCVHLCVCVLTAHACANGCV